MSSVLEENDKICGRDARSISLEAARASGEGSQDLVDNAFSAAVAGKESKASQGIRDPPSLCKPRPEVSS